MNRLVGRTLRVHFAALATYLTVAVIYTFPLITKCTTHFPGGKDDKDVFGFIWNNWWTYFAVTHLHAKPYLTHYIFAPCEIDLRLHTFGLLYGLLSIPALPLLGPVGVLNAQIFVTIAINGYASFRLAHYLTQNAFIGSISGLLVASVPAVDFHFDVGRPSCSALWPAICVLYFALRLLDRPALSEGALLAVSIVAMLLADQQIVLFGGFWLMILAINAVVHQRRSLMDRRFLMAGGIVVLLSAFPVYLLYYRPFKRDIGYTVPWVGEALTYSMSPHYMANPVVMWGIYGAVLLVTPILGLWLARRCPKLWPWLLGSVAFIVLTLGPVLDGTRIPLPFAAIQKLPGMAQFRAPYRFQIPAALGLSMTAGLILSRLKEMLSDEIWRRLSIAIAVLVGGDLIAHRWAREFQIQTATAEPIYTAIADDPRDCLVLEIPVGVRTGTDRIGPGEALSFYQPIHHKRLINGFAARVPIEILGYYRGSPALMLFANQTPPPGDLDADLTRRMDELKVGYVLVHPQLIDRDRLGPIMDLLERTVDLVRLPSSGDVVAFKRKVTEA